MQKLVFLGLFFVMGVFGTSIAHAQLLGNFSSIEIRLSPEYPKPGQEVQATVHSSSENVRASTVIWLLDATTQEQGPGLVTFTFTAPELGETLQVGVLVETPSGQVFTKTATVRPAQTTLVWEGDTYIPPFYQGQSLYTSGSLVRAQALSEFAKPNGELYDASELIYTWSKNGTVLGSLSGIGASSILTEGPKFFGSYILSVEVATPDNTQIARAAARVSTFEPRGILYERSPLTGIQYHNAIQASHEFRGSSQFEAQVEPYFMDAVHADDRFLSYEWHVNGVSVFSPDSSTSRLNVQLETDERIATTIEVQVEHLSHLLQSIEERVRITFGGSARNSLFGL